jgi:hypothetical protein
MVRMKEKILNTTMCNWKKYFCTLNFIVATTSYFISSCYSLCTYASHMEATGQIHSSPCFSLIYKEFC